MLDAIIQAVCRMRKEHIEKTPRNQDCAKLYREDEYCKKNSVAYINI